jgi:enamine deaminase RidA (YjgF/YER057c/UK114 family)
MKPRFERGSPRSTPPLPPRQEPISETRFHDLLARASSFFAEAERQTEPEVVRDLEAERKQAIQDILQTLQQHGLTVDDLA